MDMVVSNSTVRWGQIFSNGQQQSYRHTHNLQLPSLGKRGTMLVIHENAIAETYGTERYFFVISK